MSGVGEKRPPSSPLESEDSKRKMESGDDTINLGVGGMKNVDNSKVLDGIRNSMPNIMTEAMDSNMAAMEERLTMTINNMTKRLEDKIDSLNLSYKERFDNLETIQEGFSSHLQDYEDRLGNLESLEEKLEGALQSNAGLHDMIMALCKRVVRPEKATTQDEENQYLKTLVQDLSRQLCDLATKLRDKRFCISGIQELADESPQKAVVRILNQLSTKYSNPNPSQASKFQSIIKMEDIDIAYRTGKKIGKFLRSITVHLKWSQTKARIMGLKKKLMNENYAKHFRTILSI